MTFQIDFLIRFISKINEKSPQEKYPSFDFVSVNAKGNLAHLTEKNSQPGEGPYNILITLS